MIGERVYSVLSEDPSLSALITVVRPIVLEQGDILPAVTYQIEKEYDKTFEGNSGFVKSMLEVNVHAESLLISKTITNSLKNAIKNVVGEIPGIKVNNIYLSREIEDFVQTEDQYRINLQFIINYTEG